jgi:hypothetical protein
MSQIKRKIIGTVGRVALFATVVVPGTPAWAEEPVESTPSESNTIIATKAYVDGLAAPQCGLVPWTELRAMGDSAFDNPHWGDTWEAQAGGHMIRGVAACLGTDKKQAQVFQMGFLL